MDEEKIIKEMENVQNQMSKFDQTSTEYKILLERLDGLEDLWRKIHGEDPETLKVQVQKEIEEAKLEWDKENDEKNRKQTWYITFAKGLGVVGLMFVSHVLSASELPDKIDQKFIEKFHKDKD